MTIALCVVGIVLVGAISMFWLTRLLQRVERRSWW